jgi:predicted RNA-binding Zn-ribbon protein involved in translation (DUF1610 family)
MPTIFRVFDGTDREQTFEFTCPECGHDTIEETWGGYRFLPLEEVILWNDSNSRVTWTEENEWHRTKSREFACEKCGNTFRKDGDVCEGPHELYETLFSVSGSEGTNGLAENKEPDTSA